MEEFYLTYNVPTFLRQLKTCHKNKSISILYKLILFILITYQFIILKQIPESISDVYSFKKLYKITRHLYARYPLSEILCRFIIKQFSAGGPVSR